MEKNRSKVHNMLKKVSSTNFKHFRVSPTDNSQLLTITSPKRSYQNTPLKSSFKHTNHHFIKNSYKSNKHIFNKTAYGTPLQKSSIMSYISTPNENSLSASIGMQMAGKVKKIKSHTKLKNTKTREVYQSTEDQYLSEQSVKVQFCFNKKKIFSKSYLCFEKMAMLKKDFVDLLSQFKEVYQFYGIIGLDQVPYNHAIRQILNDQDKTFENLINNKIHEIIIQPITVPKKPCYDHLQLSDFKILQHLGSGGFSNVYLAKCEIDQKVCALKFIKKDSITSAKKAKMLENEKEILFTINSPHLVDLFYAFETLNYIVFGLEYCPNNNLYNFIRKNKQLTEEDAKYIFSEILNGVEYLHHNNILFRDIKLENILFDYNGKIKITDFGLSKPELGEDEITYSYCGSPEYMAPQMLAKCGHSFQVDFYALGILLYELLFGISPFYAPRKQDIFMSIMNSEPSFPKEPVVSKQVKQLIKGLLTKNPSYRIGSLKGVKQIRSHPWLKNSEPKKSSIFEFPYQNIRISAKQVKEIQDKLEADLTTKNCNKFFFPKSFVNKELMEELQNNIVILEKKKNGKGDRNSDKMIKSSHGNKIKKNRDL